MKLIARPLCDIVADVKQFIGSHKGNQDKLAKAVGVNQSTISRVMQTHGRKRVSKALREICNNAGIPLTVPEIAARPDPRKNKDLIAALTDVWDGSTAHAKALAKIIRDLKKLH